LFAAAIQLRDSNANLMLTATGWTNFFFSTHFSRSKKLMHKMMMIRLNATGVPSPQTK
jgi:hypothetical protein